MALQLWALPLSSSCQEPQSSWGGCSYPRVDYVPWTPNSLFHPISALSKCWLLEGCGSPKAHTFKHLVLSWWNCSGRIKGCGLVRGGVSRQVTRMPLRFQRSHQHSLYGVSFSLPQGCISRYELTATASELYLPACCCAPNPHHDRHGLTLWNCGPQLAISSLSCIGHGVLSGQQNSTQGKRELYRS